MPVPENVNTAPVWKPVPVIVTECGWPSRRTELGLTPVIVGATLTVNAFASVATRASGAVTPTVRAPVVALDDTLITAVSLVALLTVTVPTVMPEPNDTVSHVAKPVPLIVMLWFVAPRPREVGLTDETESTGPIVRQFVQLPAPPSGFVTVTVRAPVAAF